MNYSIRGFSVFFGLFPVSGCLFSGGDIEDKQVVGLYYLIHSSRNYELVIRQPGAITGQMVITTSIDSLTWSKKFILGHTEGEYFIIDTNYNRKVLFLKGQHEFKRKYQELGLSDIHLKNSRELID